MTQAEFWEHIEKSRRADPEAHVERLTARLAKLRPAEILAFQNVWDRFSARAYSWAVWGAAYLINGGCSDDGFIDFRSWLMLQGQRVFDAALKNPDSLADVADPEDDEVSCECYPAMDAYFIATGTGEDEGRFDAWRAAFDAQFPKREPLPKLGRGWNFDSDRTMRKKYPRLAALYLARDGNNND
jgi:hypothetical protein